MTVPLGAALAALQPLAWALLFGPPLLALALQAGRPLPAAARRALRPVGAGACLGAAAVLAHSLRAPGELPHPAALAAAPWAGCIFATAAWLAALPGARAGPSRVSGSPGRALSLLVRRAARPAWVAALGALAAVLLLDSAGEDGSGRPAAAGPLALHALLLAAAACCGAVRAGALGSGSRAWRGWCWPLGLELALAAGVLALAGREREAPRPPLSAAAEARGAALYDRHCLTCHGPAGRGDGPAAFRMQPPPADLGDPALQARGDDELERVIREGIPGTGMPGFGAVLDLRARRLLVRYLRELAAPGDPPVGPGLRRPGPRPPP